MNNDIIININANTILCIVIIIMLVYEYEYKDIFTCIRVHLSLFFRISSK